MKHRILTESDRAKIQSLWYAGLNLKTIGIRFGVCDGTVKNVLVKMGVEIPKNKKRHSL